MESVDVMRGVRSFGSTSHRDTGNALYLCVTPWPYVALECVVDKLCVLTGHRLFCNSSLLNWTFNLAHRHTKRFTLPADDESVLKFHEWMGWPRPYWADEDEETE